jgi:hypothetical protein
MARPVRAPRLLGTEGFLEVIVDPTLHLISTGVFHLALAYLVFLFNSRPPDKVQAVCCASFLSDSGERFGGTLPTQFQKTTFVQIFRFNATCFA